MRNERSSNRKRISAGSPITFFNNLMRYSGYESPAVCAICREETSELMQCRECDFVFCASCMLKLYNITGPTAGAFAQCPDCTGTDLSDVVF